MIPHISTFVFREDSQKPAKVYHFHETLRLQWNLLFYNLQW